MEVKQTVTVFSIPKTDVTEVKNAVFFRFGNEKCSEPKNKVEITDNPDNESEFLVFIWTWVFRKVITFVANANVVGQFVVSKNFSETELLHEMEESNSLKES